MISTDTNPGGMMNDQEQAVNQAVPIERREFGSLRLRGRIWWLRYRVDGKEHWESSRSASRRVAEKLLARRQAEYDAGILTAPEARRMSFADLERIVTTDYEKRGLTSLSRLKTALGHLGDTFGAMRALAITADKIVDYESARLAAGAARATVNYELATLRRAFRLAVRHRRLTTAPAITIHQPENARTGFFERDDFEAVLRELPECLRPVMTFAYLTGWRVRSEILPLTWDRVDFAAGVVRLEPGTTKNGEGRTFPFGSLPELKALLERQRDLTRALERAESRMIPHVFHRAGQPIKSYHNAWDRACARAARAGKRELIAPIVRPGVLGRVAHDFRRTAVRNLVRAGVPERVAMALTGHKTRAVFDRYNITNESDLRSGVEKLATYLKPQPKRTRKGTTGGQSAVLAIGDRRS